MAIRDEAGKRATSSERAEGPGSLGTFSLPALPSLSSCTRQGPSREGLNAEEPVQPGVTGSQGPALKGSRRLRVCDKLGSGTIWKDGGCKSWTHAPKCATQTHTHTHPKDANTKSHTFFNTSPSLNLLYYFQSVLFLRGGLASYVPRSTLFLGRL